MKNCVLFFYYGVFHFKIYAKVLHSSPRCSFVRLASITYELNVHDHIGPDYTGVGQVGSPVFAWKII